MNISKKANGKHAIEFVSNEPFYTLESIGKKSNTYRILNRSEYDEFIDKEPTSIRIMLLDKNSGRFIDGFERPITHIHHIDTDLIYNTHAFLFSWG